MVSVLIGSDGQPEALARTLGALVSGVIEGHVRDVTVIPLVDRAADDPTLVEICDASGCTLWAINDLRGALAQTRTDWLLLLRAGSIPEPGWGEAMRAHSGAGGFAGHFKRSQTTPRPLIKAVLSRDDYLSLGVMMTKPQALLLTSQTQCLKTLAKRAGAKRMTATMIVPATVSTLP